MEVEVNINVNYLHLLFIVWFLSNLYTIHFPSQFNHGKVDRWIDSIDNQSEGTYSIQTYSIQFDDNKVDRWIDLIGKLSPNIFFFIDSVIWFVKQRFLHRDWLIDWLIDWFVKIYMSIPSLLIYWLTGWSIDSLIHSWTTNISWYSCSTSF